MNDEEQLEAVGATAVAVAICRAAEARRPHAWFVDPLAEYVERVAEPTRETKVRPGLVFWVAVRTRFLDELLLDAAEQNLHQVVLLGAGLDARAFRLSWAANTELFEVDRAPVLALKQRLIDELGLVARCERHTVVADLAEPTWLESLTGAGWRPSRPTCWITEGLLVYLDAGARDALLATIASSSTQGSRLGATLTTAERAAQVDLFRSGVDREPRQWLRELGWEADVSGLADVAESYGRPVLAASASSSSAMLIDASASRRP